MTNALPHTMKSRLLALGLVCLASLVSQGAGAQGVRTPGAAGVGVGRKPPPAAPAPQAPAAAASLAPRQADFIVAVVNSEPVTNHEVRLRLGTGPEGEALFPTDEEARARADAERALASAERDEERVARERAEAEILKLRAELARLGRGRAKK